MSMVLNETHKAILGTPCSSLKPGPWRILTSRPPNRGSLTSSGWKPN